MGRASGCRKFASMNFPDLCKHEKVDQNKDVNEGPSWFLCSKEKLTLGGEGDDQLGEFRERRFCKWSGLC